ncbi:MAG: hypothetical protein CVV03_09805 [Firmicutes bacterium HGW-Firmicutes-8]|nr:MAG: hypothetical protein CVV03_09805 [Firmicutes bacterium HGW-Firmicutes-8]
MINDLYVMAQNLKEKGLLQVTTHRDINGPAKSAGIYVEIDKNKQPRDIEFVPKEDFVKLWKHSNGNHNSFPIIRVQKPIVNHNLSVDFDKIWKLKKKKEEKIETLSQLDFDNSNPQSDDIIVSKWTKDQLSPISHNLSELRSLYELISRFPGNQYEQKQFYIKLIGLIKDQLTTFENPMLELIKDILIGSYNKDKKLFCSKTQIAFDINDSQNFKYKVRDVRLKSILIRELNKKNTNEIKILDTEICQLTGECHVIEKEKYPQPKLPIIGNTYLFCNNKSIPCLTRYKMESLQSFKVGKEIVCEMNNALDFLTQADREDKTWVQVPGSKDKEQNLLIVYVEDEPELDDDLAKMMGDAPDFEQEVIKFENLTEQVCGNLKEKTERNPNAQIKAIVINRVDDMRKQIQLSETYSVNSIILGTTKWQKASKNFPYIAYRIKINQEQKIIEPFCPYPGQILNLMKKYWKFEAKNGKQDLKFEKVPGISLKEVYDVFIPSLANEQESCKKLLSKVREHVQGLIINFGHFYNRKELYKINKRAVYDNCLAISLLSILLYKLNYYKEDYMHSIAFNIGRLMMLSDVLHREYCLNVRKGDIPPRLIGNSTMSTAVEFPDRALSLLQERIMIYKAWADTDKEAKLAKWAVNKMGDVTLEMSGEEIPESFNEAERAQVLLGYLAKIEKE